MKCRRRQTCASIVLFCCVCSIVIYTLSLYTEEDYIELRNNIVSQLIIDVNPTNSTPIAPLTLVPTKPPLNITTPLFSCDDLRPHRHFTKRQNYWILHNYVIATKKFHCHEAVTYTTHCDYRFLDNLIPLAERWQGPISVAIYAPGKDFENTIYRIQYLIKCSPLVKELTSFHLYFDTHHLSKNISGNNSKIFINCRNKPKFGTNISSFRQENGLFYPVNVGRNIARDMSTTHFVLSSDIELYPNPGLTADFLRMLRRNETALRRNLKPKVFVLPIFEIKENVTILPRDKGELQTLLSSGHAVPFHKYVCEECHRFPKQDSWIKTRHRSTDKLSTFHIGKRLWGYLHWEPIFIGTKWDPIYDERLTWEGQRDKMTQGYILCVLDYEFHILNKGFLIHRPAKIKWKPNANVKVASKTVANIKPNKKTAKKQMQQILINPTPNQNPTEIKQINLINKVIWPELKRLHGHRPGCQS